jgi:hypothetical protein
MSICRHMLVILIVIAFLGGTAQAQPCLQIADGAGTGEMAAMDMPCDQMKGMDAAGRDMPCKGLTPECVKQMGCVTIPALVERFASNVVSIGYSKVVYASPSSDSEGLSRKPDLLPPRIT